ncbi:hypothetical protein CAAN3_07S01684 [[Candida] anglica]
MFGRRQAKTTHKPAYTGVNHVASADHQPNSNALAAALTIGQSLKQQSPQQPQPQVQQQPRRFSLRSNSIQHQNATQQQPQSRRSSLLKRSSSITTKPNAANAFQSFGPHTPAAATPPSRRQSVDSSYYENHAHMNDLHHGGAAAGSGPGTAAPVKMVKKYVPTANGIQIIEVPESTLAKEIARSNSLRNLPRTNSVIRRPPGTAGSHSQRTASLRASSRPTSRLSSLVESPSRLRPMREEHISTLSEEPRSPTDSEFESLDKEIEREKKYVEDLAKKRREYEQLKNKRLEEERKIRELQQSEQEESRDIEEDEANATVECVVPLDGVTSTAGTSTSTAGTSSSNNNSASVAPFTDSDISSFEPTIDPSHVVVDEFEKKALDHTVDHTSEQINSTLPDPEPSMVDEGTESTASSSLAKQLRPTFDTEPTVIEKEQFDHQLSDQLNAELLQIPGPFISGGSSSSSIRSSGSLDSPSKSKKTPVKSAMKNSPSFYSNKSRSRTNSNTNPAHQAYLSLTTAENTRLNSKLSSSQLDLVQSSGNVYHPPPPTIQSTAQTPSPQSKRMSQTLRTPQGQTSSPNGPVNGSGFHHNGNGAAQNGSLSGRSLRPQSFVDPSRRNAQPEQPKGMSGRSLRDRSSVYVAPIGAHPALQPGYQSPSKARAADLYARANARPVSTFKPQKKSSFSREDSHGEPQPERRTTLRDTSGNINNGAAIEHQATGEKPSPVNANGVIPLKNTAQAPGSRFRSRLADSDDESEPVGLGHPHAHAPPQATRSSRFASRFNDSDDEDDIFSNGQHASSASSPAQNHYHQQYHQQHHQQQSATSPTGQYSLREDKRAPMESLRNSEPKSEQKPKKKSFGKLRKLFGKN